MQYVEPALTPSILILFGFSISLGLLKQVDRRPHPPPAARPPAARSRWAWLGLGCVCPCHARGAAPNDRAPLPSRSCK